MSSPLLPPNDLTQVESSPKRPRRQRHDRRDSTGRKIIYSYHSSEFLSKYVEWRKSRFEALPSTRKCDSGWYQALSNDNIWHCWFLAGIVESETMLSRSTLAHIYDNVKAKTTSPSVGSAKRGPLGLHRARSARIQIRHSISCELIRFPLGSCAVGGRGDDFEAPEKSPQRLQRHRRHGPRCDSRCSPRDRGIDSGSWSLIPCKHFTLSVSVSHLHSQSSWNTSYVLSWNSNSQSSLSWNTSLLHSKVSI